MASPFGSMLQESTSPWLRMFGMGQTPEEKASRQIGGARSKVTARLGELAEEGVPTDQLLRKMLSDPVFHEAMVDDPDIGKTTQEMIAEIQKMGLPQGIESVGPGGALAGPDGQGGFKEIYKNPAASENSDDPSKRFMTVSPGAGVIDNSGKEVYRNPTAELQTFGGFQDLASLSPQALAAVAEANMMPPGADGSNTQKERGLGALLQRGLINQDTHDKLLGGVLQIIPVRDDAGNVVGNTVVDLTNPNGGQFLPGNKTLPQGGAPGGQPGPQQAPQGYNPEAANKAIDSIESRGNGGYAAVGPITKNGDRAYGKFGIMGANIPEWSQEVLGKPISIREFMNSPEAQEKIFTTKFGQFVQKHGSVADAANVWFTGRSISGLKGSNPKDILGTDANSYVKKFLTAYAEANGGADSDGSEYLDPDGPDVPQTALTSVQPVGELLEDPSEMFLGSGFLPWAKETLGNIGSQIAPGVLGPGDAGPQRQAMRNLRFSIAALRSSPRFLAAEYKDVRNLVDTLSAAASPESGLTSALQLLDMVTKKRAEASAELADITNTGKVRGDAANDVANFDRIIHSLPTKAQLENQYKKVRQGTSDQLTPGKAAGEAIGVFQKGLEAIGIDMTKGVEAGQKEAEKSANPAPTTARYGVDVIKTMDKAQLSKLAAEKDSLTTEERAAAAARFRELRGVK